MAEGSIGYRDFFISRAGKDAAFAIWVGKLIAAQGKTYVLQDEHFGHQDFMGAMHAALKSGARVVALLSQAYLDSKYCLKEATTALQGDPFNEKQRLILLRLEPCAPDGMLAALAHTSLFDEQRQPDWAPLALKMLRAFGFQDPKLDGLPPPPSGTLSRKIPLIHPEIRPMLPGLAPREELLAGIAAAVRKTEGRRAALTNAEHVIHSVVGMAGVGKTVLAREFAWRHRSEYEGVWWVTAETPQGLLASLAELGARLSRDLASEKETEKAARRTLELIENAGFAKPWLLVYDNVEKPGDLDTLTPRAGAHVLITTRWAGWDGQAEELPVDVFEPQEALDFLLALARKKDRDVAARLAADLGYLPLALAHARALAWSAGWDFEQYRAKLPELIRKAPGGAKYPKTVFATFDLAIAKATAQCAAAEKLMGICAFLAPDRIPLDIVTADVMSEIERGEAVAALQEVSLVTLETLDDGSAGISVHRLVQEVMRGRLRGADRKASPVGSPPTPNPSLQGGGEPFVATAALAARLVADAFPFDSDYPQHWPTCRRLESHTIAVLDFAPNDDEPAQHTVRLLYQYSLHLNARADFAAAEPLTRRALTIDERRFGPDHPQIATGLNNLAQLLQVTNRLREAEPLMRRALTIDQKSLGPEHPNVAIRLNNLAALLLTANRLSDAEPLMRRALAIDETSFGPEHPNVAVRLNNLVQLLQATNRLGEAEPLMHRALAIDEKSFGPEHPKVAIRLSNLAALLYAANRLSDAEPLMRRALAIDEKSFGPEHPTVAIRLNNLAQLLQGTGRLGEAEPLMRRALAINEKSFGLNHPEVGLGKWILGNLLQAMGRLSDAEPCLRRAVQNLDASGLPGDHPWVKGARANLASLEAVLRGIAQVAPAKPNDPLSLVRAEPPPEAAKPGGLLRRLFGGGS